MSNALSKNPRIISPAPTSTFIRDYLAGNDAIAPFYTGHPLDFAAYERKANEVRERMTPAVRARVADAYRPLNDAAREKLQRILGGDGFVVTTGQQAGLFTGPLYTVYKALSAVRLASVLEERMRCPVLAVFWVAADDHDWAEVDHIRALDAFAYTRDIRVDAPADAPAWPMSRRLLGNGLPNAIDELRTILPPDGFGADTLALIRKTYAPEKTVAAAFEDMMAALLADFPIAIVSSAHPSIKTASLPLVLHELAHADVHEQLITRQTERLEAAGYRAQVPVTPGASNVFLLQDTGRDRLVREKDAWSLRRTGARFDNAALLELAKSDPQTLSANVFLRPVIESSVFPTLAYVGGPAETAYFAQIGCLFEAHGIQPPVVFPRHSLTVVEEKAEKTLQKFVYDVSNVAKPFAQVVSDLVKTEMPADVRTSLDALTATIRDGYKHVEDTIPAVDPSLAGPVRSSRRRAELELRRIEKQIDRQFRHRNADRIETLRRAASMIQPDGSPQERVLNITHFLAAYGPGILKDMHDAMPVALDRTMPKWSGVKCDDNSPASGK